LLARVSGLLTPRQERSWTGIRNASIVGEQVGLLAREWPEDYPAGAVEWLLAAPDVRPTPMALDLFDHGK